MFRPPGRNFPDLGRGRAGARCLGEKNSDLQVGIFLTWVGIDSDPGRNFSDPGRGRDGARFPTVENSDLHVGILQALKKYSQLFKSTSLDFNNLDFCSL